MSPRSACAALLLAACGSPAHPTDAAAARNATALAAGPARFAWKAPFSVHVTEDATKDKTSATLSYWLDVCPKAPDLLVITHRDFRFVTLMGKPASTPEFAPALAQLTPLLSALPRFTVDPHGTIIAVEGLPELLARLRTALPGVNFDDLQKTLDDPAVKQAAISAAAERWNVWVRAWLSVDGRSITAKDVAGPHRVNLSQSAHDADIPDPNGSGAKIDIDVTLRTDTEWPAIRPWTASSEKTVRVKLNGDSATRRETHRYAFDWGARDGIGPECGK